jgi:hypothetical protein
MKKYPRYMFMALIAMLLILALPGCDQSGDDGADPPPSSGRYESVEDLANLADIETGGTYTVILGSSINISERWGEINAAVKAAKKYVVLDLGACVAEDNAIIGKQSNPSGNQFNIIQNNSYITAIILPESLQYIEGQSFRNCIHLTSVVIPDGVLSIGSGAFMDCSALRNIIIPDSITSIADNVFQNCTALTSISISDSVNSIGSGTFQACTALTSISIPHGLVSLTQRLVSGCTSLVNVSIPDSVTSIESLAFRNCTGLDGITIPSSVTSIEASAFYGCTVLTSVVFAGGSTIIANDNSFPAGASLRSAYSGGGAGTYTLSGGSWSKNP